MAKKLEQHETLSESLIAGSDAVFDYICQSCNEDGKQLEAVGFCVDCSEFLCDECFRCHLKPRISRHHKLLDIEEATKDETEKCAQHRGEVIKYFCLDHDCLGCGVCLDLDHRNCQAIQCISKVAKDMGSGEEFSTLIRDLDKLLIQTRELADTSLGKKLKSQDIFDQALSHVKQVKKELNEALNKLEKEIETEAKQMKKKDMVKMEENIKSCDNIQTKAKTLSNNMKAMQKKEQYCNLFVAMKTTKLEVRSIVKSLEDLSKDNTISNYLFQYSEQLDNFLKHGSGSLGKLFMKDETQTKAKKVGEISVNMDSDTLPCEIIGMTMISSGRLAAADFNNKKVKLIDIKQSKVISEYQLPPFRRPQDITTTEATSEIAVTLSQSEIVLIRVKNDKLYEHKKIRTTSPCYGIACIKDKLLVSLEDPQRLEIIDTRGNVLQTIQKDPYGKQLFIKVRSITICQDTSTIYVPDYDKGTVTRLSLSGHVLGIHEDSRWKGAYYVTVDKGGAVYVCGERSQNIHQITADGKKIRTLLTRKDGLHTLLSLCYDGNTDCLYVGQWSQKAVLVYQLL